MFYVVTVSFFNYNVFFFFPFIVEGFRANASGGFKIFQVQVETTFVHEEVY